MKNISLTLLTIASATCGPIIPGRQDTVLAMPISIPAKHGARSIKFGVAPEVLSPSLPIPRVIKVTAVSVFLPK